MAAGNFRRKLLPRDGRCGDSRKGLNAAATRVAILLAVSGTFWVGGCRSPYDRDASQFAGFDRVQKTIEAKLAEQRAFVDGTQRWEEAVSSQYQDDADIAKNRQRIEYERDRDALAKAAIKAGPLSLEQCLVFAVEFNDALQAQRARIRSVGGETLIARSRFFPQLSYTFRSDTTARESGAGGTTYTNQTASDHAVRLTQTLLEFGKDVATDVNLRTSERDALFGYEDAVADTVTAVRKKFFAIILRSEQLAEREKSLREFEARYEQVRELEKARRVLEVDVLTARLNMLNEKARINSLQKEILRQKTDLANSMGFPVGLTAFGLEGRIETLDLPLDSMVNLALRRSPFIARLRAEVAEQARLLHQLRWEYAPTVAATAGWKDTLNTVGLKMGADSGTYRLSTFAEAHSGEIEGRFNEAPPLLGENDGGWFSQVAVSLPVFQGLEREGRRRQAQAVLEEKQHRLRGSTDAVELAVRKAYQTMEERRQDIDILREAVSIARERLRVQERLKELGKISDNELETFRNAYFVSLDGFFTKQIELIGSQEDLRREMRCFNPLPPDERK